MSSPGSRFAAELTSQNLARHPVWTAEFGWNDNPWSSEEMRFVAHLGRLPLSVGRLPILVRAEFTTPTGSSLNGLVVVVRDESDRVSRPQACVFAEQGQAVPLWFESGAGFDPEVTGALFGERDSFPEKIHRPAVIPAAFILRKSNFHD